MNEQSKQINLLKLLRKWKVWINYLKERFGKVLNMHYRYSFVHLNCIFPCEINKWKQTRSIIGLLERDIWWSSQFASPLLFLSSLVFISLWYKQKNLDKTNVFNFFLHICFLRRPFVTLFIQLHLVLPHHIAKLQLTNKYLMPI